MLTFFIKRPRFAMVIALVITLVGAIALRIIPVEQYPQIAPPVVNVSASWPGASSADVAEAIATPLETQLNGVDHMLYMESTSSDEGTYSLNITFAAGTDPDLAAIDDATRRAQRQHANLQAVRHEFRPGWTVRVFTDRRQNFWVGDGKVQIERFGDVWGGCLAVGQGLLLVH